MAYRLSASARISSRDKLRNPIGKRVNQEDTTGVIYDSFKALKISHCAEEKDPEEDRRKLDNVRNQCGKEDGHSLVMAQTANHNSIKHNWEEMESFIVGQNRGHVKKPVIRQKVDVSIFTQSPAPRGSDLSTTNTCYYHTVYQCRRGEPI
jgi:hypothetical protein